MAPAGSDAAARGWVVRTAALAVAGMLVFVLAGCEKTIDADKAADSVNSVVSEQAGFTPDDTECEEDVKAEAGETFDCTFTGPDGDYVAHVDITEVDGDNVHFRIQSEPTGN